jgi:hypothetical protein
VSRTYHLKDNSDGKSRREVNGAYDLRTDEYRRRQAEGKAGGM